MENDLGLPQRMTACKTDKEYHDIRDLTTFHADIEEIVDAFAAMGGVELSQMKKLWQDRLFSFIHEAKPTNIDTAFFMQAMYSYALGFLQADMYWSKKLGGLYVLYILYETQFSKPPIKIYLSPDDLENIYFLIREAKIKGPLTAMRIVNKMMVRDFFLYGFVSTNLKRKMKEAMSKLPSKTTEHIRAECKRLFSTPAAKSHFQGNLVKDLGLDALSQLNGAYAIAKQHMYSGGDCVSGSTIGPTVGEELKKCAYSWIEQRKRFYSLDHKYIDIAEKGQEKELKQGLTEKGVLDDDDEFDAELERALELS